MAEIDNIRANRLAAYIVACDEGRPSDRQWGDIRAAAKVFLDRHSLDCVSIPDATRGLDASVRQARG